LQVRHESDRRQAFERQQERTEKAEQRSEDVAFRRSEQRRLQEGERLEQEARTRQLDLSRMGIERQVAKDALDAAQVQEDRAFRTLQGAREEARFRDTLGEQRRERSETQAFRLGEEQRGRQEREEVRVADRAAKEQQDIRREIELTRQRADALASENRQAKFTTQMAQLNSYLGREQSLAEQQQNLAAVLASQGVPQGQIQGTLNTFFKVMKPLAERSSAVLHGGGSDQELEANEQRAEEAIKIAKDVFSGTFSEAELEVARKRLARLEEESQNIDLLRMLRHGRGQGAGTQESRFGLREPGLGEPAPEPPANVDDMVSPAINGGATKNEMRKAVDEATRGGREMATPAAVVDAYNAGHGKWFVYATADGTVELLPTAKELGRERQHNTLKSLYNDEFKTDQGAKEFLQKAIDDKVIPHAATRAQVVKAIERFLSAPGRVVPITPLGLPR
jgi:hypothetical protein